MSETKHATSIEELLRGRNIPYEDFLAILQDPQSLKRLQRYLRLSEVLEEEAEDKSEEFVKQLHKAFDDDELAAIAQQFFGEELDVTDPKLKSTRTESNSLTDTRVDPQQDS